MPPSSTIKDISRRGRTIYRLQFVNLLLSWTIFFTDLGTSLGSSSFWVILHANVFTFAIEAFLLAGDRKPKPAEPALTAPAPAPVTAPATDAPSSPKDSSEGGDPEEPTPDPTPLPIALRRTAIVARFFLLLLWLAGWGILMWWTTEFRRLRGIIEIIIVAAEIGVIAALVVLSVLERRALLKPVLRGEEGLTWYQ